MQTFVILRKDETPTQVFFNDAMINELLYK